MPVQQQSVSCPLCGGTHSYSIEIPHSTVQKSFTPPRFESITRLLTCPVKNQTFQASFPYRVA